MKPCLILILIVGIACSSKTHKIPTTDSLQHQQLSNNNPLTDKRLIYHIADSIITNYKSEYFHLSDFDTTYTFITEDYFTNNKTKTTLVLLGAVGIPTDGTEQFLLLLLSYTDTYRVICVEQSGEFTPSDIRDLNGDGIKEIIIRAGWAYEGASGDSYDIVNFKNGKKQTLFSASSVSQLDYNNDGSIIHYNTGDDVLAEHYKVHDTLEHKFECSLISNKAGTYNIRQIETSKINNGGANDSEIVMNLIIKSDTTEIILK